MLPKEIQCLILHIRIERMLLNAIDRITYSPCHPFDPFCDVTRLYRMYGHARNFPLVRLRLEFLICSLCT